ncbi:disease resistance RPP13-like protein 4 [Vitis riparia]|uniref:disease resistance RPP13-like protein 4 n=1 Tax=Vitis riparia TaxID=96939 RepID=UPI00155AE487|nr:disease resistance RPP13-like protein 4 [Vitis riparia]
MKKDLVRKLELWGLGVTVRPLWPQSVFDQSPVGIVGIWINLQAIQKGEIDFKKILKAMLKQCDGGQRDSVEVEELLEALCKALWSKSYLLVFDGIWDINLDWYFRLKERLQWCNKSNQSRRRRRRIIIITTRLDGVAKRMVGPNNLYRIQPFSDEDIWLNIETFTDTFGFPLDHPIVLKTKDEIIYHCHGLPLTATTLHTIMVNRIYRGE